MPATSPLSTVTTATTFTTNDSGSSCTKNSRTKGKQRKWMYKQAECQVHPSLKTFPYDKILRRRTSNDGVEEVKVKWKPCSGCGMKWADTWEPYNQSLTVFVECAMFLEFR